MIWGYENLEIVCHSDEGGISKGCFVPQHDNLYDNN